MKKTKLAIVTFVLTAILFGCQLPGTHGEGVPVDAMVRIPAGWFVMGSDTGPHSNQPAHRVYLSEFEIDRSEVTNEQYRNYVADSGEIPLVWRDGFPDLDPHHPVTGIIWEEAAAFCMWYGKRLPTEAEWEKAARGSDERIYPWGNTWDAEMSNTFDSGHGGVVEVGSYPGGQSPYGALDMVGNAQEWVADFFDPTYYQWGPEYEPQGSALVLDHGLRGGSWASQREHSSVFYRDSSHSVLPNSRVGFRCAADR